MKGRMRPAARLASTVGVLLLAACGDGPTGPADPITELPRALSSSEVEVIGASNAFAIDLLSRVHAAAPDSTVFLSPLSASYALGMTMNGAAGATRSQMHEMLGFGGLTEPEVNTAYRDLTALLSSLDPSVELGLANAAFHREDFALESAFVDRLEDFFDARVEGLDFSDPASAETMNAWVRAQTNDRIEKIIDPPLDAGLVLLLMNAVWFKGDWTVAFDPEESYDGPFTRSDGGSESVRFMTREDTLATRSSPRWQAVELPYGGGAWTHRAAVPRAGSDLSDLVDDLPALLDPEAAWDASLMTVHLPRFELDWERTLNDDLEALGMVDAFDPGEADFTRITPGGGIWVDYVKQKTFLKIDEIGTEARPELLADRPFFLAIRERLTGTVLFAGLIVEPPVP